MKVINNYLHHSDERGSITGLVNFGRWEELNIITSSKDAVRGNHYHKSIIELFIVLEGKIKVVLERITSDGISGKEEHIVKTGDVFMIEPLINHTFICLEDSRWMNLLSKKMDKMAPDIFKGYE